MSLLNNLFLLGGEEDENARIEMAGLFLECLPDSKSLEKEWMRSIIEIMNRKKKENEDSVRNESPSVSAPLRVSSSWEWLQDIEEDIEQDGIAFVKSPSISPRILAKHSQGWD